MSSCLDQPLEPDPVIEAYKKDVDVTLLLANLELTYAERLRRLQSACDFLERVRGAAGRRPPADVERGP
jgi:hypothetical protein